jgi:hypothetical protein
VKQNPRSVAGAARLARIAPPLLMTALLWGSLAVAAPDTDAEVAGQAAGSVVRSCCPWPGDRPPPEAPSLTMLYFHRTLRCQTCLEMERIAAEIWAGIGPERGNGWPMRWQSRDYELPENAPLVDIFSLDDGPALLLVRCRGERIDSWRELKGIWDLTDRPDSLTTLISTALRDEIAVLDAEPARREEAFGPVDAPPPDDPGSQAPHREEER